MGKPRRLEFTGQSAAEEGAEWRHSSRKLHRVPSEYIAQYPIVHVCVGQNYMGLGKEPPEG